MSKALERKFKSMFNRGMSYIEILRTDLDIQDSSYYNTLEVVAKELGKFEFKKEELIKGGGND